MVLGVSGSPIFVLDHAWDIVLRNAAAIAVFGGSRNADERTNMLEQIFLGDGYRELFAEYDEIAEGLLAMFRLEFPAHAEEARSAELVERLRAASPRFEELWKRYDVKEHPQGVRKLNHPVAGPLVLEPSLLGVVESPGLRMMLYTPSDAATSERIHRLVANLSATENSAAAMQPHV
jgi:PAS domain-containing protein